MGDEQIRALTRQAMAKRPNYARVMRARNAAVILGMLLGPMILIQIANLRLGTALVIAGAVGTLVLLLWNMIWVNTVLFRITREEVGDS